MKRLLPYNPIFWIVFLFISGSCKKHVADVSSADVYLAGNMTNDAGSVIPVYWKNGNPVKLANPDKNGIATGITVAGTDVYVAGYVFNSDSDQIPVYWKNGVLISLHVAGTRGGANAITLAGNDVYVAGYIVDTNSATNYIDDPTAVYWKNGTATMLPYSGYAQATAIAGDGTNVYLCGYSSAGYDRPKALYWKNGVVADLGYGQTNSIGFSGTDVYIGGTVPNAGGSFSPGWWKNGVVLSFPDGSSSLNGSVAAISVAGAVIYMAGQVNYSEEYAVYWKDGERTNLTSGSATAIAVTGTDVYVAGQALQSDGRYHITVWKNGKATVLTDIGNVFAMTVIAKQ